MFVLLYANYVPLYANCMQMENYHISIVLDKRFKKSSGKYPVKIRVFTPEPRRQKLYRTNFDFSETDFQKVWQTKKPQGNHKELKSILEAVEAKAQSIAANLQPFTFEQFEAKLYNKTGAELTLQHQYQIRIKQLQKRGQVGTASNYQLAENSFIKFIGHKKYSTLTFKDINKDWLQDYENFMIELNGRSATTVSMYVRTLRTLFNEMLEQNLIEKDFYPFGKKKYVIPSSQNIKKALDKIELKALFESEPQTPEQQKAKDFWFFSYACNGINIKDILLLKYKDIKEDEIQFNRAKTKTTSKGNQKQIEIILNDFTKNVLKQYGTDGSKNDFVFDILDKDMTPLEQQRAIKNFTKYINQHIKKLAASVGITSEISTYWARHSFASNYLLSGANITDVMESLGHSNVTTTQNYLKSLNKETKRKFAKDSLNFQ